MRVPSVAVMLRSVRELLEELSLVYVDVYKRQEQRSAELPELFRRDVLLHKRYACLLYTSRCV